MIKYFYGRKQCYRNIPGGDDCGAAFGGLTCSSLDTTFIVGAAVFVVFAAFLAGPAENIRKLEVVTFRIERKQI